MTRAEYVGPLPELAAETALIRPGSKFGWVLAQFDDWVDHPETGAILSHGWHTFPAKDFRALETST